LAAFFPSGGLFSDFVLIHDKSPLLVGDTRPEGSSVKVVFFSGIAVVADGLVSRASDFEKKITSGCLRIDEMTCLAGCYSLILQTESTIIICNDLLGLCPLYVYEDNRYVIVSNRTHLVSHLMLHLGIRRRADLDVVLASLSSTHRVFLYPHCHRTYLQGLKIVPADSFLTLSEGRIRTVQKSGHNNVSCASRYGDLVEEAASDITQIVRAVVFSTLFENRVLDISGGQDSRLVFGAVVSLGLLNRCATRTVKTDEQGDQETGIGIAKMFGATFDRGDNHPRYSKRTEFSVAFWRSMKAGVHHKVGLSNWPSLWQANRTVRLNGGCGEVYRNVWFKEALFRELSNVEAFGATCRPGVPRKYRVRAFDSLWSSINSMPGQKIFEKVHYHYAFFLNPFHFGIPQYNQWYGYLPFSSLQSKAMLKAARMLDCRSQCLGKVIFDVTTHLKPVLAQLPFADGSRWPETFLALHSASQQPFVHPAQIAQKCRAEYESAEANRILSLHRNSVTVDALTGSGSLQDVILQQATTALSEIRDSDLRLARYFDTSFDSWLSHLQESKPQNATALASKILALYDLCVDDDTSFFENASLPFTEGYSTDNFRNLSSIDSRTRYVAIV
jgi:hypothetical protein